MERRVPETEQTAGIVTGGPAGRAVAVLAFGISMGYLEAAVVVYLRAAIGSGAVTPAQDPATLGTYETVEAARELATVIMIAAVGWLAGRSGLERLAWAAVVFGAWDIVYYAGLQAIIGWPATLDTWDVLFLVPKPWVAPVWAPIAVSTVLVVVGLAAAWRIQGGRTVPVGPGRVAAALAGGGLVIVSFVVDTDRLLAGDTDPGWTGWPIFWVGMALAAVATLSALTARPALVGADTPPRGHGAGSAGPPGT